MTVTEQEQVGTGVRISDRNIAISLSNSFELLFSPKTFPFFLILIVEENVCNTLQERQDHLISRLRQDYLVSRLKVKKDRDCTKRLEDLQKNLLALIQEEYEEQISQSNKRTKTVSVWPKSSD